MALTRFSDLWERAAWGKVAIKISAAQFSGRFEREALAAAALNHPNICNLHDVGPNYLVMELAEGETLAACIARGALPREFVLRYAATDVSPRRRKIYRVVAAGRV